MSRREGRADVRGEYAVPPSNCAKVLYYTWKLCSVVFSHLVMISLVVAYCILGAVTFEKLESQHEIQVKQNISQLRNNATTSIWRMTKTVPLLDQSNWTTEVVDMLKDFENAIILEMKVRGWDGSEQLDHVQWTFTGALFYSIIVITTIGYGHITPKTQTGKVVTIFYAILGIPLMLLCLSNIGDVMASSFRFLYWRACCYVCTRPPSKRRRRHHSAGPTRRSIRGRPASIRRRPRAPLERCYSDTDCRYRDSGYSSGKTRRPRALPPPQAARPRPKSQPPASAHAAISPRDYDRDDLTPTRPPRHTQDHYKEEEEDFPKISLPLRDLEAALKDLDDHQKKTKVIESRSKSLPKQSKFQPEFGAKRDWESERHYELDDGEADDGLEMHDLHDVDYENYKERKAIEERDRKLREREDHEIYRDRDYDPDDDDFEFDGPRGRRYYDDRRWGRGRSEYVEHREPEERRLRDKRARSAVYDYERRPDYDRPDRFDRDEFSRRDDGKNRRLRRLQTVDDSYRCSRYTPSPEAEWSDEEAPMPKKYKQQVWNQRQHELYAVASSDIAKDELKPVPIWLCVFLVASYIVAGTFLFKRWEGWPYLDAAYFCFITLTTIGFGDFVPAQSSFQGHYGEPTAAVHSIALCSLYLLFGIALLAMSFNLVQEEVRANVAALATKLGIIKSNRNDDDDTDTDY